MIDHIDRADRLNELYILAGHIGETLAIAKELDSFCTEDEAAHLHKSQERLSQLLAETYEITKLSRDGSDDEFKSSYLHLFNSWKAILANLQELLVAQDSNKTPTPLLCEKILARQAIINPYVTP